MSRISQLESRRCSNAIWRRKRYPRHPEFGLLRKRCHKWILTFKPKILRITKSASYNKIFLPICNISERCNLYLSRDESANEIAPFVPGLIEVPLSHSNLILSVGRKLLRQAKQSPADLSNFDSNLWNECSHVPASFPTCVLVGSRGGCALQPPAKQRRRRIQETRLLRESRHRCPREEARPDAAEVGEFQNVCQRINDIF